MTSRLPAGRIGYLLLALCGLLLAWAGAWPWGGMALWWLQPLVLALAVWLLAASVPPSGTPRQRFRHGFWRGWLLATVWLASTFWWLYISMHVYGGMLAWLSALAVLLLAAALALYYALACGLWLALHGPWRTGGSLLFAALWLLAELCRGVLFTGFPWGALGYAHVEGPLAGWAPWLGVYGIGFLASWIAALLAMRQLRGRAAPVRQGLATAAGVVALLLAGIVLREGINPGLTSPAGSRPLGVELMQGNIPQNEKFLPNGGIETALLWYGDQLMAAQAPLVLLPETALPLLPEQLPPGYWQALQQRFATGDQAALIGTPAGSFDTGLANAVVGMVPGGAVTAGSQPQSGVLLPPAQQPEYRYLKQHLVPFGEFVPYGFQWFVDMMVMPLGNFLRGDANQPRLLWQGQRIQPNICYEDLFGEELAISFTDPGQAPTMLANVSNIAWFGDTVAIDQHRHISRMRAMELGRPMLRATNTGSTAIIDHLGRVQQELPRLERGVLRGEVQGREGLTPFARWAGQFGLWPLWLLGMALLALFALRAPRPRG